MEDDDDDKPKGGVPPPPPPNPAGYPPPPTAMPDAPPMMPPYGMPPPGMYPPGMYPPPPPAEDDGLESKRQRTEESSLIPEHIFLDTHGPTKQITISVTPSATNPPVQIVGLPLTLPVLELKKRVEVAVGMPASKQKLVTASGLPLRNEATLAFYNLKDGDQLRLMVRERGGRR
ncbi:hypothetical protein BJ742DRAFT_37554 [Cladochytrium replicatum]|nr:hypothetical protein BJ742DRAFT_37554 [Cladochytrium replicatum]